MKKTFCHWLWTSANRIAQNKKEAIGASGATEKLIKANNTIGFEGAADNTVSV